MPRCCLGDHSDMGVFRFKLKDIEWFYRDERGLYRDMNTLMLRRLILHGKPHKVDSMKSQIRLLKQRTCADTNTHTTIPSIPNPNQCNRQLLLLKMAFLRQFNKCCNV